MDLNPILTGLGGTPTPKSNPAIDAVAGFTDMLRQAETQATAAVTGGADPHALVTALAEGKLAIDTVVTVRDRVIEAYQEILRMPV
ncbi:flagellar hook-basal body complex protein FliE [Jannaschia pohangensis]|uniref:Flagellar hook-basal body complex protein FliE n=1 Tax=Jannaschia pohangensis TaxID=390807 RepID=A0A1I3RA17_9RHOB|nr:flagellar hook-basal body complex protein FliE [Jannaschia pohangensis]SFJ42632.1 flagellar hook-basal body complex protein FliE [Jannaschia pohangensis]